MVLNNSANIKGLLLMFLIAMPMSALADDALLTDAKTQAKPAIVESSANDEQKPVEKNPSFNVFEFQIDGNTVLPKGKLEEAVYPFLG